jgi:hypothetical protein
MGFFLEVIFFQQVFPISIHISFLSISTGQNFFDFIWPGIPKCVNGQKQVNFKNELLKNDS